MGLNYLVSAPIYIHMRLTQVIMFTDGNNACHNFGPQLPPSLNNVDGNLDEQSVHE